MRAGFASVVILIAAVAALLLAAVGALLIGGGSYWMTDERNRLVVEGRQRSQGAAPVLGVYAGMTVEEASRQFARRGLSRNRISDVTQRLDIWCGGLKRDANLSYHTSSDTTGWRKVYACFLAQDDHVVAVEARAHVISLP